VVVAAALDRLGRRLLERVRCRDELAGLGVPVHSVREGGELSELVGNVLAAVAQEESRHQGERIAAAARHVAAGGWHAGGAAPWGYRWRPATAAERAAGAPRAVLEADPATAPRVRALYWRAAHGASLHELARWLEALPGAVPDGRRSDGSVVALRLRSPVYVARPARGDPDVLARPPGRWPALVDDALWRRVQRQLAVPRARHPAAKYLLTGFLRCARCGGPCAGRTHRSGRREYGCSRAPRRDADPAAVCGVTAGAAGTLEDAALARVGDLVEAVAGADGGTLAALRRAWRARGRGPDAVGRRERLRQLDADARRAAERLVRAGRLLATGDLDAAGHEFVRAAAQTAHDDAQAALARLRADQARAAVPPLSAVRRAARVWAARLAGGRLDDRRTVLAALVDRCTARRREGRVDGVDGERGRPELRIEWTPLGAALSRALERRSHIPETAG
jgi:hypothetical protein